MDSDHRVTALLEATGLVERVSTELQTRIRQSRAIDPTEHAQVLADASIAIEAFRIAVRRALDGPVQSYHGQVAAGSVSPHSHGRSDDGAHHRPEG